MLYFILWNLYFWNYVINLRRFSFLNPYQSFITVSSFIVFSGFPKSVNYSGQSIIPDPRVGTNFRPIFVHNFGTGSPISKFFFLRPSAQKIRKRDFFAFFKIFYPFLVYGQKRVPKFGALRTFTNSSDHNFWTVRPIFKIFFLKPLFFNAVW